MPMQWKKTVLPGSIIMPLHDDTLTQEELEAKMEAAQKSDDPFTRAFGENVRMNTGIESYLLKLPKMNMFALATNEAVLCHLPDMPVYQLSMRLQFVENPPLIMNSSIQAENDEDAIRQAEYTLKLWVTRLTADLMRLGDELDVELDPGYNPEEQEE